MMRLKFYIGTTQLYKIVDIKSDRDRDWREFHGKAVCSAFNRDITHVNGFRDDAKIARKRRHPGVSNEPATHHVLLKLKVLKRNRMRH